MNFIRASLIYGISGTLSKFSGFILVPIYTRILSMTDYALLDLATAISAIILVISETQAKAGMMRGYFEHRNKSRLIGSTITYYLFTTISMITLAALIYPGIRSHFPQFSIAILGPILACILPALTLQLSLTVLRLETRPRTFLLLSFGQSVASAVFGIIAVTVYDGGVAGVLWGITLSQLIFSIAGLSIIYRSYGIRLGSSGLRSILSYGIPMAPAIIGNWGKTYINRFFIISYLSLSSLAIFAVADRIAAILLLGIYAFRTAWDPYLMKLLGNVESKEFIVRMFEHYIVFMFIPLVAIAAISPGLVAIIAPHDYQDAAIYIPTLLLAIYWDGTSNFFATGNIWMRKTYINTFAALISMCIIFVLLYLFISPLGLIAAPLAVLIGTISKALYLLYTSQKLLYLPYSRRSILACTLSGAAFIGVCYVLNTLFHDRTILHTIAILACGLLFLWPILIYSERASFRSLVASIRRSFTH